MCNIKGAEMPPSLLATDVGQCSHQLTTRRTEMDTMGSYSFLGELSAEEYQELKDEINAPWPEEEQQ